MTWKRCDGCTRAISSTAFTCEYCGHVCQDVLSFLPTDDGQQPEKTWPGDEAIEELGEAALDGARPVDVASNAAGDALSPALPLLELDDTFPFAHVFEPQAPPVEATPVAGSFGAPDDRPASEDVDPVASFGAFDAEPAFEEAASLSAPRSSGAGAPGSSGPGGSKLGTRQMAMMGGALFAAAALIFTILSMRGSASPDAATAAVAPSPAAPRPAAARRTPAASPRPVSTATPVVRPAWNRVTTGRWVGNDRKTVAFELPAVNKIHIWTRDVTPVLVVRCQAGHVEPFVFTQSAARMEPEDEDHTVHVGFDQGQPSTERWPDSVDHDALFARDANGFARQLAAAHTLRFTFTPHNAEPATATFEVSGISELLAATARQCGWKS